MDLNEIIKRELDTLKSGKRTENYMFFSNLKQIQRQCEILLELDPMVIEDILQNGHDWADDHITVAKENVDQVMDFFMNKTEEIGNLSEETHIDETKNKPTNPKLWASSLAWAKSRYDVCPSAYCNGAAAKRYKSKGGKWKKNK
jgi:hypothetical protein